MKKKSTVDYQPMVVFLATLVPMVFAILYWPEFTKLSSTRAEFIIVAAVLFLLQIALSVFVVVKKEEVLPTIVEKAPYIVAVACAIWIGAWCAQLRWEVVV